MSSLWGFKSKILIFIYLFNNLNPLCTFFFWVFIYWHFCWDTLFNHLAESRKISKPILDIYYIYIYFRISNIIITTADHKIDNWITWTTRKSGSSCYSFCYTFLLIFLLALSAFLNRHISMLNYWNYRTTIPNCVQPLLLAYEPVKISAHGIEIILWN